LPTFTLLLALAAAAAATISFYRAPVRAGAAADCGLAALAGAAVGGRLLHVLLNAGYFAGAPAEALRLSAGGLDWHGALLGGLVGLRLMARWRGVDSAALLDRLALALPLVVIAVWWGCLGAACGYGAEVDTLARYPAWAVAELPDVYGLPAPRWNTQLFGMALGVALLPLATLLAWRGWLRGRRFWLLLALASAGMFLIGFARADAAPVLAGLRADQWLDAVVLALALRRLLAPRREKRDGYA
jgi:phosphatidylglycerol:prolipoprotein diacylglycerol transferase